MRLIGFSPSPVGRGPTLADWRRVHRLLIVDDETPIAQAMARYFRGRGYAVDVAHEREEAEVLLVNRTYAAILLDLRMTAARGAANGLEMVGFARERCPSSRILILTAYGTPAAETEARERGADAFLHKPQPLANLAQLLEALLGERAS